MVLFEDTTLELNWGRRYGKWCTMLNKLLLLYHVIDFYFILLYIFLKQLDVLKFSFPHVSWVNLNQTVHGYVSKSTAAYFF